MATTYLQLVNRVMRKLGEDELDGSTTELTEDYQKLVGDIINDVKEEVEDAHQWRALRQTINVTILAGAQSGTVTGANERSRLVRIFQQNRIQVIPLAFDITDSDNPDPLIEIDLAELIYRDTIDTDTRQDPTYFALDNSSGDGLDLFVWPRPSGDRTIQLTITVPQARFADTDLSEIIKIPVRPIFVGAVWHAMEERGEELGTNGQFNEQRFNEALATAVSRDDAEAGNITELVSV